MPKSTAMCNAVIGLWYNATAVADIAENDSSSPIATIEVALATASYVAASTLASNETTYTDYVRQSTARSVAGWDAPSGGATANAAAIEFPQCGASGATITSAAAGKPGGGAAQVFHYGDLNAPIAVSNQIQPRFPIGAVTITET
jgi:hypothetical protein